MLLPGLSINTGKNAGGSSRTDCIFLLTLCASWIAMAILANPIGDFPINDDWAYAMAVRTLLDQGRIVIPDWAAMNLLVQILWGAVASLLLGFSYTTLRYSCLVLGLAGVLIVYLIHRELRIAPAIAFVNSSVLAVSALYFGQSLTFMTDIPFFAFAFLSVLYFVKALQDGRTLDVALGAVAAGLAILIRQTGLVLPFAFAVAFLFRHGITRQSLSKALLPLAAGIAVQYCYQLWLTATGRLPAMYNHQVGQLMATLSGPPAEIPLVYFRNASLLAITTGLCLAPALILPIACWFKAATRWTVLAWAVVCGALFLSASWLLLYHVNRQMPVLGNILVPYGLGPLLPHGSWGLHEPEYLRLTWRYLTLVSIAGALGLLLFAAGAVKGIVDGVRSGGAMRDVSVLIFLVCLVAAYCAPVLGIAHIYDRYVIFLLPLGLLIVAIVARGDCESLRPLHFAPCLMAVLLYGAATVMMAHDFQAWNRSRWDALHWLMDEHKVPPRMIDGGLEFSGAYLYDPTIMTQDPEGRWWVKADEEQFLIAFTPIAGYEPFRRFAVDNWLPFSPAQILVLRNVRNASGPVR